MISPAARGIKAGLAAIKAGKSESEMSLPPAEHREMLGFGAYDQQAKKFIVPG